jgi:formate hydrogenlyase subunit 3/multisubunit Na+/H+ antiporter MnhD subunit
VKSISSAIVVAAGIYALVALIPLLTVQSSFIALLGVVAGMVTLALGLVGWWATLKYDR